MELPASEDDSCKLNSPQMVLDQIMPLSPIYAASVSYRVCCVEWLGGGGLLPAVGRGTGVGGPGCVPCLEMKPFGRSIICLCSCCPVFVRQIDSKLLFLRPYHESQRRRPNLILRSSNIPQSNITRLRSYHIQRERAILFHHSSPPSPPQSSTNAGLFSLPPKTSLSYWTE